jgi:hypothetical protein
MKSNRKWLWYELIKKIIRNILHTNPCVCDLCLNQSFSQLQFQLYFVANGKMPYNHIFNYNIVISYGCDYNLQSILNWMKMKDEFFISFTIDGVHYYIWKFSF